MIIMFYFCYMFFHILFRNIVYYFVTNGNIFNLLLFKSYIDNVWLLFFSILGYLTSLTSKKHVKRISESL